MSLVTTYLEIDQKAGINILTHISVTETYLENFFNRSSIHISCQLRQTPAFLNNSMALNKLLSAPKLSKWRYRTKLNKRATHKKPVKVRHGTSGATIRFKIYVNCGPGDNPAQSEVCGHIGGQGNYPCRKCHVGGTQQFKETDTGFHSIFEVGQHFSLIKFKEVTEFFSPPLLGPAMKSC